MTPSSSPFWKSPADARQYDEFTKTTFAVIYPAIARQVLERTGISRGICLDVGSGPAPLAIALALQSDLRVTALDSSPEMQSLAARNIHDRGLEGRVIPMLGDVHAIPVDRETFDLVVSRGSYHFWGDLPGAFREIYRVLKPGGMAYIGGGYGSLEARERVLAGRKKRGIVDDPDNPSRPRFRKFRSGEIESSIETAGIGDYRIISDDSGFWMLIRRSA
jgi:ubiquinone/menaquinone biosynthesis C-methylase UbiE